MFNKVIIVGYATKEAELKSLPSGSNMATLNLASSRKAKKSNGETYEETCFIDVKIFGKLADVIGKYINKGSKVLIEGYLKYESWNDKEGKTKSRHIIVAETFEFLGNKNDKDTSSKPAPKKKEVASGNTDGDDEIPF